jgi:hypothetical protein
MGNKENAKDEIKTIPAEDDEEEEKTTRQKLELPLIILSFVLFFGALLIPMIFCDILGSGANYFKSYSMVEISGSAGGNSQATFFFGLFITPDYLDKKIPLELFMAQWQAIGGNSSAAVSSFAFPGHLTLILIILIFVVSLLQAAFYIVDRVLDKPLLHHIVRYFSIVSASIEGLTAIWQLIIIFGLLSRIDTFNFSNYDFMAYGGLKFIFEAVLGIALCTLNVILFIHMIKAKDEAVQIEKA